MIRNIIVIPDSRAQAPQALRRIKPHLKTFIRCSVKTVPVADGGEAPSIALSPPCRANRCVGISTPPCLPGACRAARRREFAVIDDGTKRAVIRRQARASRRILAFRTTYGVGEQICEAVRSAAPI